MQREFGTLGDHVGRFHIRLHCRCGHAKRFDAAELARRLGAEYPNRRLVDRARCEACGASCSGMTVEPIGVPGYGVIVPSAR